MLDNRLREKLVTLVERYRELDLKVADPEVINGDPAYSDYLREHGSLAKQIAPFQHLQRLEQEVRENQEALEDPELRELAEEEIQRLNEECETLEHQITDALSPSKKDDNKNVILEIRAGTGGDEACLFAGDLMRMYSRFAEERGWTFESVSLSASEGGGIKEIIVSVQGEGVFGALKHEGGGHRVQRVPETESQGRVHTSAATVAVLPEAEEYEVELKPDELQVEVCRSTGPGGQSVNTTDSAVKILHLPTGISVHMQDEKSQHKNKAKAMRILRSRVYEHYQAQLDAERDEARRSQTGSGDRSQRVRTYNFPQNRCTDHRLGKNFPLGSVIEGQMGKLIDELTEWGKQMDFASS